LEDLAEQELLKAAQEIDRATARLRDQIKPKASKLQGMDDIDIVGPIIDSAAAITSACGVLVKAAHDAQRERVEAKRDGKSMYRKVNRSLELHKRKMLLLTINCDCGVGSDVGKRFDFGGAKRRCRRQTVGRVG
jgi:hypothetical protein